MPRKEKMFTRLLFPKKVHRKPLKRSMSGFETEMFILDQKGGLDSSDRLVPAALKRGLAVKKECAKSMVEVVCLPHRGVRSSTLSLVSNMEELMELAERMGLHLYPFATYPGVNTPVFRKEEWYRIKKKVFGRRFTNAGRCCGYHQHYAMPRGMYDRKRGQVRYVVKSKLKKTLIDSYNVLNAIDPIITVFLQSSPFAEGRHLAKDSRLLLYRGGKKLGYMEGLYARRQFFGGLSPYKQTLSDLMGTLERKHRRWIELMAKHGFKGSAYAKSTNILHFSWNAVKVSPKGTLEYRGADMNLMENILGATTLVKFLLRKIQQDFMFVVPADMEMKEAFKQEGNLLFIPPHSVVRKELQKRSAYQGLADKELYRYVKRFMRFMGPNVYKEYRFLLRPLKRMVDSKRTVSDQILKKARKDGYGKGPIPERYARELALFYAERFRKDIPMLKEKLENIVF